MNESMRAASVFASSYSCSCSCSTSIFAFAFASASDFVNVINANLSRPIKWRRSVIASYIDWHAHCPPPAASASHLPVPLSLPALSPSASLGTWRLSRSNWMFLFSKIICKSDRKRAWTRTRSRRVDWKMSRRRPGMGVRRKAKRKREFQQKGWRRW